MNRSKRNTRSTAAIMAATLLLALLAACGPPATDSDGTKTDGKTPPTFSLAWSEYPSWSTFGVAGELGLIKGKKGEMGDIEKKWNVDIELKEADYDSCMVLYGSSQCDAVCITNMDVLVPALSRASVAILPTSTSNGADACIVTDDVETIQDLKDIKVYGLAKTVSEYCFVRNLEIAGEKEADYTFTNMDPGAAAMAMQQKNEDYQAIVVWNPFVLSTLNKRKDTRVIFDSTMIPGEIIDMVAIAQSSLDKPGGEDFARAVVDTFHAINQRLADAKTGDATLVALGEKFSNLDLASMKKIVVQTEFYKTPEEGIALLESAELKTTMKKVVDFCVSHDIVASAPGLAYGDPTDESKASGLRFEPKYLRDVLAKNAE